MPHGVVVSTGCLGRFLHCREGRGLYAAVQPCMPDRRPDGEVTALGPLVCEADAAEVAAWLRAGMQVGPTDISQYRDDGDRLARAPAGGIRGRLVRRRCARRVP
ncbi:hypothetical protein ABZ553_03575 [Streptomyces sparsogenes]|uniref:hypothetical protein n=1 Tax=Streptomyces sparsogenes TaxID=67365 RepID=UPI0033F1C8EF